MPNRFVILLLTCVVSACGSTGEGPTGSTCPSNSTLTYDSFGKQFMSKYCVACHSSALTGSQRNGAPDDHNFDTLAGIHSMSLEHLDEGAAAGPNAVNTAMPPQSTSPTESERKQLGEWLACGAP